MRGFLIQFSSVAQSCPTLQPHGVQHTRLPCSLPTPGACSNLCPSRWWYQTISVIPFSSCLQSFPASGSFPMSWVFTSGSQSIGAWASSSVFPISIQGWFPLGLTCDLLAVLCSKGGLRKKEPYSRSFSSVEGQGQRNNEKEGTFYNLRFLFFSGGCYLQTKLKPNLPLK